MIIEALTWKRWILNTTKLDVRTIVNEHESCYPTQHQHNSCDMTKTQMANLKPLTV